MVIVIIAYGRLSVEQSLDVCRKAANKHANADSCKRESPDYLGVN